MPVVVDTDAEMSGLAKGQRTVFRNPRGQQNYYVFYQNPGLTTFYYAWSADGVTWNEVNPSISASFTYDFKIREDDGGSQLILWMVMHRGNNVQYRRATIADASNTIVWGNQYTVATTDPILGGKYAAVIARTDNGRIVIAFTDDINVSTEDYRQLKLIGSDDDSANPTWSGVTTWDDPSGDVDNDLKGDVRFGLYQFNSSYPNRVLLCARVPDGTSSTVYRTRSAVPDWNGTVFSNTTAANIETNHADHGKVLSCLVDTDDKSHVIAYDGSSAVLESKKGATAGDDDWGSAETVKGNDVDAASLSIDISTSPDKLYAVYHDVADSSDFHYKTSPVDTVSWGVEQTITIAQDVVALSSAGTDQVGSIHIMGKYGTTVFYHEISLIVEVDSNASFLLAQGQNRTVFRNPRGLQRYYMVYYDTASTELRYAWSSDGESWTKDLTVDAGAKDSYDLKIRDDGSQLRIYLVYHEGTTVYYRRGSISDASSTISWAAEDTVVSSVTDILSGSHCCAIADTDNDRLVVAFTEDENVATEDYRNVELIGSDGIGDNPAWSGQTQWFDSTTSTNNDLKDEVWFALASFNSSYPNRFLIVARVPGASTTSTYLGLTAVPEWGGSSFTNLTTAGVGSPQNVRRGLVLSGLIDSGDIAHIVFLTGDGDFVSYKAGSTGEDNWGSEVSIRDRVVNDWVDAATLSIDFIASPNVLYAFYHWEPDTTDFNYKTSPVDTISWSSEKTVSYAQDVTALSASERDQMNSIHIAGVRA